MLNYWNSAKENKYIPERNISIIRCVQNYKETVSLPSKNIFFDLDGTLTVETEGYGTDVYKSRTPVSGRIDIINGLYDSGHKITIYTARHEVDREVTEKWLSVNLISYHELIMEKPKFDILIDDKAYHPVTSDKVWGLLRSLIRRSE